MAKANTKNHPLLTWLVDSNGCHICISHKTDAIGYPRTTIQKKSVRLHRHVYEQRKGLIPKGMCVCHKCDNRQCINPEHLFLGSIQDNNIDMMKKNRCQKGQRNGRHKITEEQAQEILKSTESKKDLSKKFGITEQTINLIIRGKRWGYLNEA